MALFKTLRLQIHRRTILLWTRGTPSFLRPLLKAWASSQLFPIVPFRSLLFDASMLEFNGLGHPEPVPEFASDYGNPVG